MKSINDIIGGAQGLLDISFELQSCFEEKLNNHQKTFLQMMRVFEENMPALYRPYKGTGRRPYQYLPFLKSLLAKSFYQIASTAKLIERLKADPNMRLLCGFKKVPGEASFSRTFSYLAGMDIIQKTHDKLTEETFKNKIIYHISRDSTTISAREKAEKIVNKRRKTSGTLPKKLGRPPGTTGKHKKLPSGIEMQLNESPDVTLERLNKKCTYGAKQNSQGNYAFWKGYKLHLDVSDSGYPITACVTGANVQDSLLAIPMEKITEQKVTFCYSLMDKGYDANLIHSFIREHDRIPIIKFKRRNNGNCPVLDPAKEERYKIRSTVERANSHLKDSFIPKALYVKGYPKVSFVLFSAVLCLAIIKHLQFLC